MTIHESYHIYTPAKGGLWLSDDEKSWTVKWHDSASLTSAQLAADIAEREIGEMGPYFIFALVEAQS